MEEDPKVPLILGQQFMLTVRCVVDMGNENLELSVEDQKMTFNLFEAMKHPSDHKACFRVHTIEHMKLKMLCNNSLCTPFLRKL